MCLYLNIDLNWKGWLFEKTDWLTDVLHPRFQNFDFSIHPNHPSKSISITLTFFFSCINYTPSSVPRRVRVSMLSVRKEKDSLMFACLVEYLLESFSTHTHLQRNSNFRQMFAADTQHLPGFFFCAVLAASEINWYYTTN